MFIRFVLPLTTPDPRRSPGIFRGLLPMRAWERLDGGHRAWLEEEIAWFGLHLRAPREVDARAVFWFRPDAGEALTRIWALVRIVEDEGVPVHVYRTRRPGSVVYEDEQQVAAVPWRDSFDARVRV
jgi:hypothetical protein